MRSSARVDFRQFEELQRQVDKLQGVDMDSFCKGCAKEITARLLAKVIKRTPVGQYDGRTGGTLRRGWTAGRTGGVGAFANTLNIKKIGDVYEVEIINSVEYASYVEYGHRTRDHSGWVPGRFMLTISEREIETSSPKILERKLVRYIEEVLND